MTIEVVQLGTPKPAPYAASSPEERLEAATRLIEWQQELRGRAPILPRSEWPGEAFICGVREDLADVEELGRMLAVVK
jgi:hypothetical protein